MKMEREKKWPENEEKKYDFQLFWCQAVKLHTHNF